MTGRRSCDGQSRAHSGKAQAAAAVYAAESAILCTTITVIETVELRI